jgi:hypothetical protein
MSVVIDITSQFTGQKAFRQAESAADKLGKTVKHALIGVGVAAFAKETITLFAQQQKSIALFSKTLNNLGFGFATADSLAFVNSLKLQFGITDQQLMPAYEQLLATTKSIGAAQNLTNIALDVAAQQNISVTSAADALSKAYLGNTKSLGSLGLGIDKATLASGNYAAILKEVTKVTAGAATAAANTFAGKLVRLKETADEAKTSIGEGLVNALMAISGTKNFDDLQTSIINFGNIAKTQLENFGALVKDNIGLIKTLGELMLVAFAVSKVAAFIEVLMTLNKAMKVLRNSAIAAAIAEAFMLNPIAGATMGLAIVAAIGTTIKGIDLLTSKAKEATDATNKMLNPSHMSSSKYWIDKIKSDKIAADTAAKEKAAAAAKSKAARDQAATARAQFLLDRSGTILDVGQAEIYAALQGKITDEEKLRLDLQLALLTKNATAADQLSQQLLVSQLKTTDLAKTISSLPKALNPFAEWPGYIQELINMISGMNALINQKTNAAQQVSVSLPSASSGLGQAITSGQINANLTKDILTGANPNSVAERERLTALASGQSQSDAASVARWTGQAIAYFESQLASQQAAGQTITVNIDASSMIDPSNLTKVIQQTYIDLQKGGYSLAPGGYGFGGG